MGNRYTAVTLRCGFPVAWLARMDDVEVEREIVDAVASWGAPDGPRQLQHLLALCSRVDLALYRGEPEAATPLLGEVVEIRRAFLDRAPIYDLLLRSTLGRHAIACAAAAPAGSARRREALHDAKKIVRRFKRAKMPLMRACAAMIEGAMAEVEAREEAAIASYRGALALMLDTETNLFGNAVKHRLGTLIGGDAGAALQQPVTDWLGREGVRRPTQMLQMLLPAPG